MAIGSAEGLPQINASDILREIEDNQRIDYEVYHRDSIIEGDLDLGNSNLEKVSKQPSPTRKKGPSSENRRIRPQIRIYNCIFNGTVNLRDATFDNTVHLENNTFRDAFFSGSEFNNTYFTDSRFLRSAEFNDIVFKEDAILKNTTFRNGTASISSSNFKKIADFSNARFFENTTFRGSIFESDAYFYSANFTGLSNGFEGSEFNISYFSGSNFSGDAIFNRSTFFDKADFSGSKFYRSGAFNSAGFENSAIFKYANFTEAFFLNSIIKGAKFQHTNFANANFMNSRFTDADFSYSDFNGSTSYFNATFEGASSFEHAGFNRSVNFSTSKFNEMVNFQYSKFKDASFAESLFQESSFRRSNFTGLADFRQSNFGKSSDFTAARFEGYANFSQSQLGEDAIFDDAQFREVNLTRTKYGTLYIRLPNISGVAFNESAYHLLIENFDKIGLHEDATNCYYRLMKATLQDRLQKLKNKTTEFLKINIEQPSSIIWNSLTFVIDSYLNLLMIIFESLLLMSYGFGTRLDLPLIWSTLLILGFGIVWWNEASSTPESNWEYLNFSATLFLSGTKLFVDKPELPAWLESKPSVHRYLWAERALGGLFSILLFISISNTMLSIR